MPFTVTITRGLNNRKSDELVQESIQNLVNSVTQAMVGRSWVCKIERKTEPVQQNGLWVFTRKLTFSKTAGHKSKEEKQWRLLCRRLIRTGQRQKYGKYPWLVSGSGAEKFYQELEAEGGMASITKNTDPDKKKTIVVKCYGKITTDPGTHFQHLFDREHQIKIILSAIKAAVESEFNNRFHCVLYGEPGCGKSDILSTVGKMLGEENDAYLKLDATSTTQAGAQKILLESEHVPPVLLAEEIEKTDENSLRWFLGILDHRAEIRKTNFHIGTKARNVKMLCLATVNDLALFKRAMSGALHSRFAHEIYCPRPTRTTMQKILERELAKTKNGNTKWIEPTLNFCMDEMKWDDPRKIIPVCLCGQDQLLDGSYQESIKATMVPKN